MSTTYLIYTEAKMNDEWRCIDGFCWFSNIENKPEEKHLLTTFESGSRSYFGQAYDKLQEIGLLVPYSELSIEVREEHPGAMYVDSLFSDDEEKREEYYLVVPSKTFDSYVPEGCQHHGVYHKDSIFMLQNNEIEELYEDADINIKKLPKKERKCYQYYEWDSIYDWSYWFKILKSAKDETVGKYFRNNYNYFDELPPIRLVVMAF